MSMAIEFSPTAATNFPLVRSCRALLRSGSVWWMVSGGFGLTPNFRVAVGLTF